MGGVVLVVGQVHVVVVGGVVPVVAQRGRRHVSCLYLRVIIYSLVTQPLSDHWPLHSGKLTVKTLDAEHMNKLKHVA